MGLEQRKKFLDPKFINFSSTFKPALQIKEHGYSSVTKSSYKEEKDKIIIYFEGRKKSSEDRSTWNYCSSRTASSSPSCKTPTPLLSDRRRCPQVISPPAPLPRTSPCSRSPTPLMVEKKTHCCYPPEPSASLRIRHRSNVSPAAANSSGPYRRIFSDDPVTLKSCL